MTKYNRTFPIIILVLATVLSLLNKGNHDLQEWDESRNGVNAYEMLQNGDYVNYYYNNELDTWNAKPPLMIWLIVGSYKILGFNEFAMRFPSTLATIAIFMLCFFTIKIFETEVAAFLTCLILLSCKAILGNHIGLTGDFDALLLVFLIASVYSFVIYLDKGKKRGIYLTAIFTGLAFYTKGPASLVFIPGFILYALLRRKGFALIKDPRVWISVLIFIIISGSWFYLSFKYGKTATESIYGSKSSLETMLIHDTYRRLTKSDFGHTGTSNRSLFFFFETIDARMNLWNYFFYPGVLIGGYFLYRNRRNFLTFINEEANRMLLVAFCLIAPLSAVLTLSLNQHNWYLAPVYIFVAFIIAKCLLMLREQRRWFGWIVIFLFVFTFVRHISYVCSQSTVRHDALTDNKMMKNKRLIVTTNLSQDMLLYLKWLNTDLVQKDLSEAMPGASGDLILVGNQEINGLAPGRVKLLEEYGVYCLAEIK